MTETEDYDKSAIPSVEYDPIFVASPAYGITLSNIADWNTAFSWGDHAGLYSPLGHNHDTAYSPLGHNHSGVYDPAGTGEAEATAHVAAHEAASDPHTGYRLESADHSHQSAGAQAGKLDHGLALDGLGDDDHTQYIKHSLATAINDFLLASGAGAFVKKTLAETIAILGVTVFQKARAYRANAQTIPDSTWTKIEIDTDSFDPTNITDLVNHRIIPTIAGYYQVNGSLNISVPTVTALVVSLFKNTTEVSRGGQFVSEYGGSVSDLIYLNGSTDYIELKIYQISGGTRNLIIDSPRNYLSVVGPF